MPVGLAAATDPEAEAAAQAALAAGGGSIDAMIAAFFASAGHDAGSLLGPVVALVAGVGMSPRWVDGRGLQPGLGIRRPRGLVDGQAVPDVAYAAVPRSIAALALLHAYGARLPLGALVRRGIALAEQQGALRRAATLDAIGHRGAGAARTADLQRAVLQCAGLAAGGLITEADLQHATPAEAPAQVVVLAADLALALPTDLPPKALSRGALGPRSAGRRAQFAVAADGRGAVAAIAYCPDPDGPRVEELELRLARDAVPVRRGISRVTPGTPRASAAPIAVLSRATQGWFAALGIEGTASVEPLPATSPTPQALRDLLELFVVQAGGESAVAASAQRRKTALTRVGRARRDDQSPGTL